MKYLILCFIVGVILGWFLHYILRQKTVGVIKMIDHDEATSMFLELNEELEEVRKHKRISLRVENSSYNENQNY